MMTPTALSELIRRTSRGSPLAETDRGVLFQAPLDDSGMRQAWLALRETLPPYLTAVVLAEVDTDADLNGDDPIEAGALYRISLTKVAAAAELRLFFSATLPAVAEQLVSVNVVRIADMAPHETFATLRNRFETWTEDSASDFAPAESLPDPRAFARDFTHRLTVPNDLRPWLRRAAPEFSGAACEAWRALAAPRLLAALSDEVSIENNGTAYHLSGPPKRRVLEDLAAAAAGFEGLSDAGDWVYAEGLRDAETRHLLFASEWARTALSVPDESTLASAKSAYSAYVKAGSKETLKALADLRKAVIEETQKASQRAQDLTSGLWKDLAVAASPFVLKVFADSSRVDSALVSAALAIGAAFFLVLSLGAQLYINHRYFRHQGKARGVWRSALNTVLTHDDIRAYSETPIADTEADYRRIALVVALVYAVLVLILLGFAFMTLCTSP